MSDGFTHLGLDYPLCLSVVTESFIICRSGKPGSDTHGSLTWPVVVQLLVGHCVFPWKRGAHTCKKTFPFPEQIVHRRGHILIMHFIFVGNNCVIA